MIAEFLLTMTFYQLLFRFILRFKRTVGRKNVALITFTLSPVCSNDQLLLILDDIKQTMRQVIYFSSPVHLPLFTSGVSAVILLLKHIIINIFLKIEYSYCIVSD